MEIKVLLGDITEIEVDAIVNPANSYCLMGGGVAAAIKEKGGTKIEDEALLYAPIPVGEAAATSAGRLPSRLVIHAPTMTEPAQTIDTVNVRKATRAALLTASENKVSSLAFPGMGTGVGGVPKQEAAKAMVEEIKANASFDPQPTIFLVAHDKELYEAFEKWTKQ